jgi:hypothetical protein
MLVPMLNGGESAVLYCFIFLYLVSAGGGAWSMDRAMGRDKGPEAPLEEPPVAEIAPAS